MTPVDLRNETWADLQGRVTGQRLMVLEAFRTLGRSTTRRLATLASMDILTVRPRATELCQYGLLRLVGKEGHEGLYEAVPLAEARALFEEDRRQALARGFQEELPLEPAALGHRVRVALPSGGTAAVTPEGSRDPELLAALDRMLACAAGAAGQGDL